MIKRTIFCLLALVLVLSVAVPVASASSLAVERQVFTFLTQQLGLNTAAACGVLANIEAESDFRLTCWGDNNTSFGLCQWHNSRFEALKAFCLRQGYDYKTVEGQMNYLAYELKTRYQSTYAILLNVPNTSDGAYTAAYAWCVYFEVPANREQSGARRGRNAQMKYWVRYGGTVTDSTELPSNSYSGILFEQYEEPSFYWDDEPDEDVIPGTTIQRPETQSQTVPPNTPPSRPGGNTTDKPADKKPNQSGPSYYHYVPHHLPAERTEAVEVSTLSVLFVTASPLKKRTGEQDPGWEELPDEDPEDALRDVPAELRAEEAENIESAGECL